MTEAEAYVEALNQHVSSGSRERRVVVGETLVAWVWPTLDAHETPVYKLTTAARDVLRRAGALPWRRVEGAAS